MRRISINTLLAGTLLLGACIVIAVTTNLFTQPLAEATNTPTSSELGLAETSSKGSAGGYAIPASGGSVIEVCGSDGTNCDLFFKLSGRNETTRGDYEYDTLILNAGEELRLKFEGDAIPKTSAGYEQIDITSCTLSVVDSRVRSGFFVPHWSLYPPIDRDWTFDDSGTQSSPRQDSSWAVRPGVYDGGNIVVEVPTFWGTSSERSVSWTSDASVSFNGVAFPQPTESTTQYQATCDVEYLTGLSSRTRDYGGSSKSGGGTLTTYTLEYNRTGQISTNILTVTRPPECSDLIDNDGDGWIDYPDDPGCETPEDPTENPNPQCSDGVDNVDAEDTLADAADDGCWTNIFDPSTYDKYDDDETLTFECNDGVDNGDPEDSLADAADPGCHFDGNPNNPASYVPKDDDETDNTNTFECSDGRDNDDPEDTLADAADPGCYVDQDISDPAKYRPFDDDERDTYTTETEDTTALIQVRNATLNGSWRGSLTGGNAITAGQQVQVRWESTNATQCDAVGGAGFSTGGRVSGTDTSVTEPTAGNTETFRILCGSASGAGVVIVEAPVEAVSSVAGVPTLEANPVIVPYGDETTLTWSVPGGTAGCTLTGPGVNMTPSGATGNTDVAVFSESTYTLSCPGGSDSVTVQVLPRIEET